MMPMHYTGTFKGERKERAMELLDMVDLPDVANKYPSQISGGQQQRAAIARALANNPKVLVGDEPTGNLDIISAGLMFAMFEDLVAQGTTIVMVTHDRDIAGQIPRVEEVRDGQLVPQDQIDRRLVADAES
jgi:putative ABC transport system ATP-binding protein